MTNEQLKTHMRMLVDELNRRQQNRSMAAIPGICQDLFAVSEAVQKALVDNNCLP